MTDRYLDKLNSMPKADAHKELYRMCTGCELNLDEPQSLNEKLQWLMVNRYDRNVSLFADKLAVRDYVRECGFPDILTELYGVFRNAADIDINGLPERFVLKANHGSGPMFYSICHDKRSYAAKEELNRLGKSLTLDFSRVGLEYHYKYIEPMLFCEELLTENGNEKSESFVPPVDYKFFCFGGKARYIKVIDGRGNGVHQDYYDTDWNYCEFVKEEVSMCGGMKAPAGLKRMVEIASKLSEPFPMARVDLYYVNGRIYFGEITLTPATGLNRTDRPETLRYFGELTELEYWKPELLSFKRSTEVQDFLRSGLEAVSKQLMQAADNILSNDDILNKLERSIVNKVMSEACRVISGDFDNVLKCRYLTILYRIAFREDMSLEEAWQIYWNINRTLFINHNLCIYEGSLDILYRHIFSFVRSLVDYEGLEYRPQAERNSDIIVMCTSQFLKEGHAPTTRVLDYSYVFQRHLGKKVIIINDAGMHYYESPDLEGVVSFNYYEEHSSRQYIEHRGERFEFLQVGLRMPDIGVINELVRMIYSINPLFVYNIGGSCLTSDLCTPFVTTASLPCSFSFPVTAGQYLLLGRELMPADNERLQTLMPHQSVIVTNFNYTFRESTRVYTRAEFSIPEDAFVISVVGNRLDDEINEDFVMLLNGILAADKTICVALVGEMRQQARIIDGIDEGSRKRLFFTGGLKDASEFIRLTDLNINPDRSGGGRAAFEAYYYGIPTVSLRKGDAYHAGGSEFGADDYGDYLRIVTRYVQDDEFYGIMRQKAKARAGYLGDMTGTQRRLLEKIISGMASERRRV